MSLLKNPDNPPGEANPELYLIKVSLHFDSISLPVSLLHATEHEQVENGACKHSPHYSPEATEQRMSPPLDPAILEQRVQEFFHNCHRHIF